MLSLELPVVLTIINMAVSVLIGIFVVIDRRQRATLDSIQQLEDRLEKRLVDTRQRIQVIDNLLHQSPERGELVRLHERIDELFRNTQSTQLMVGELCGQVKQMNQRPRHE